MAKMTYEEVDKLIREVVTKSFNAGVTLPDIDNDDVVQLYWDKIITPKSGWTFDEYKSIPNPNPKIIERKSFEYAFELAKEMFADDSDLKYSYEFYYWKCGWYIHELEIERIKRKLEW